MDGLEGGVFWSRGAVLDYQLLSSLEGRVI